MSNVANHTARTDGLKKVTYAIATADLNNTYPFATLAKALGYFEDEGLDVDLVPAQSSTTTIQTLISRRADVGVLQAIPVMIKRANDAIPLVSFYAVSLGGTNLIVTRAGSSIRAIADLKGRQVGVPDLGSGDVIYLSMRLREAGMSLADVRLVATGSGAPSFTALDNGSVDATIARPVNIMQQRRAGYAVATLPRGRLDDEIYGFNLFAREDYIAGNPKVIAGLGRATARATAFAQLNPAAAVRIFWRQFPDRAPKDPNDGAAFDRDLASLKAALEGYANSSRGIDVAWGHQEAGRYAYVQSRLAAVGLIHRPVDPRRFYTSRFEGDFVRFDHRRLALQSRGAGL